ncbi:MAG: DUF4388 domain-containing protein [Desulfomonilaceae bacterium]
MSNGEKKIVSVGSRLAGFIGAKASREKKLQAAAMQAEFTLHDTLIILCYLSRDTDPEISSQARKNLIPAARNWFNRPDRPELPEPIREIVLKVIEKLGLGEKAETGAPAEGEGVAGNIGLLGLGELLQAIDHNNRTVHITLSRAEETATVYTESGKVIGAVAGEDDGLGAVYKAFGWIDASFRYVHAPPGDFSNRININTLNLVMAALEHTPDVDPFEDEASRGWTVDGHLKAMNIFEISEIFEMNSKQAVCRLKRDGEEGDLHFKRGRIVNAFVGGLAGMDAAYQILAWPNAHFSINRGGQEVPEVIHAGMQNLIIEAMRLLDEGVTVTERIASELALINDLFEGQDVVTLPILEKVRLVFSEDQQAREALESDANPLVRKALRVKISKTVHKYLNPSTDHDIRLKAARGKVPVSTTEKLVLLSYLSHDESQEIREEAKNTLASLDIPTYRKGFGSDLHPSVMDFLIREAVRDESLITVAVSSPTILEETALHILDNWQSPQMLATVMDNRKLLEKSPSVASRIAELVSDEPVLRQRIDGIEESLLQGEGEIKVEGPLGFCGLAGLIRAAAQGARSGTIVLEAVKQSGRVFFRRGRVIGAVLGSLEGKAAIEAILQVPDLKFRYSLRTHFHVENVDPVIAEELLLKAAAGPSTSGEGQTWLRLMSGSPEAMDILEVLSALEGSPVPMAVSLLCEEGSGEIFRDRTRILHASVEGKEGPLEAMAAMIAWRSTRFLVRPAHQQFPITVDKALSEFFIDAMRLIPQEITRVTKPGELPEWELSEGQYESLYHQILGMGVAEKVKLAFLGNREARDILVRDPNKMVALAAVRSPKIQESEIEAISKSKHVCEDVLRQIANTKEWSKLYHIKFNLASNSKTPIPIVVQFLPHLRELDLRKLAKSKNISQVVATQARRIAETKSGA